MLVPEARATTAFRLHSFAGAEEAAAFIQRWFRPGTSSAVIVFWALHEEPLLAPGEGQPEAIALVREEEGSDVVYFSSFSDMDSAQSLVRAKAEQGLDLRQALVYWTAPVTIDYDKPGAVRLTPATRSAVHRQPDAEPPPALQEDRPQPQTDVADEPPEPAFKPPEAPAEALDGGEDTAAVDAEAHVEAEPLAAAPDEVEETVEVSAEADVEPEPLAAAPYEVEETVEVSVGVGAPDTWGSEELAEEAEDEAVAIDRLVSQLDKVLRVSRWDEREGPFEGFGSPPGKF